jgi:hypothetical protein
VFLLDTAGIPADPRDADRAAIDQFRQRLCQAGLIHATFATGDGLELSAYHALTELVSANARSVPRQLPAAVPHFAGRAGELATLTGWLRGRTTTGGTAVIFAISGAYTRRLPHGLVLVGGGALAQRSGDGSRNESRNNRLDSTPCSEG